MQHPPVNTQVLAAAVLLEHSDLVPQAVQLRGETHTLAKVHHVDGHSALVQRAPRQRGGLDWTRGGRKCALGLSFSAARLPTSKFGLTFLVSFFSYLVIYSIFFFLHLIWCES